MPSPFPGMDPYIEGQTWPGFHTQFIAQLQRELAPLVRPRYRTYIEESVYLRQERDSRRGVIRPGALVVEALPKARRRPPASTAGVATLDPPVTVTLPQEDHERQVYLEIRRADTGRVACIIELLSPFNKEAGSGRQQYLSKRTAILWSLAHLVELDLLRAGERLPTVEPVPPADHYAFVSRVRDRPRCGVWPIGLRERLPAIPVPLLNSDPDVQLDLQSAFDAVYDGVGYGYSLNYEEEPDPPLAPEDRQWVRTTVREWRAQA